MENLQEFIAPIMAADFENGETEITNVSATGVVTKYLLLSTGKIAIIREGKGKDVEKATMEANGDQSKYLTSMMAATVTIDGKQTNMFQLSDCSMKDYMKIQIAFSEVNF